MSQATNDPIPITTPLNISALARDAGVDRKTVKRRLAKGWRPPAPTPPSQAPSPLGATGRAAPVNGAIASMASACPPLSIAQLRDEIRDWAALYRKVAKMKALERSGRTGRALPLMLLVVAVAFYGLIAYAAVN